jgi:hypothetical protein
MRPIQIIKFKLTEGNLSPKASQLVRNAYIYFAKEGDNALKMFLDGEVGFKLGRTTVYRDRVYSQGKERRFNCEFIFQDLSVIGA